MIYDKKASGAIVLVRIDIGAKLRYRGHVACSLACIFAKAKCRGETCACADLKKLATCQITCDVSQQNHQGLKKNMRVFSTCEQYANGPISP